MDDVGLPPNLHKLALCSPIPGGATKLPRLNIRPWPPIDNSPSPTLLTESRTFIRCLPETILAHRTAHALSAPLWDNVLKETVTIMELENLIRRRLSDAASHIKILNINLNGHIIEDALLRYTRLLNQRLSDLTDNLANKFQTLREITGMDSVSPEKIGTPCKPTEAHTLMHIPLMDRLMDSLKVGEGECLGEWPIACEELVQKRRECKVRASKWRDKGRSTVINPLSHAICLRNLVKTCTVSYIGKHPEAESWMSKPNDEICISLLSVTLCLEEDATPNHFLKNLQELALSLRIWLVKEKEQTYQGYLNSLTSKLTPSIADHDLLIRASQKDGKCDRTLWLYAAAAYTPLYILLLQSKTVNVGLREMVDDCMIPWCSNPSASFIQLSRTLWQACLALALQGPMILKSCLTHILDGLDKFVGSWQESEPLPILHKPETQCYLTLLSHKDSSGLIINPNLHRELGIPLREKSSESSSLTPDPCFERCVLS